jgi:hypothetical protein
MREVVPESKHDLDAAKRAVEAGWPAVEPVVSELLEWVQDYNWPVASVLAPFLARIGTPLVPYLRPILTGDDVMWKYWVVLTIVTDSTVEVVERLRPELEQLVATPKGEEAEAGVPEAAAEALERVRTG